MVELAKPTLCGEYLSVSLYLRQWNTSGTTRMVFGSVVRLAETARRAPRLRKSAVELTDSALERIKYLLQSRDKVCVDLVWWCVMTARVYVLLFVNTSIYTNTRTHRHIYRYIILHNVHMQIYCRNT